ncbi:MAG: PP2C family protein-serine/threonine phosphatase [Oscillospiraceae bacterium]|nr:PP2C family protein-serine/threonine phosphatase [Oscillospiraceae bacterium]
MEHKKLRLPLLTHIALLFILAALVAIAGVWLFSRSHQLEIAAQESGLLAKSAAMLARRALVENDPDFLTQKDEGMRERMHQIFRGLCKESDLAYLYLYTVDSEGVRHHLITAAGPDDEDAAVNAVAGYGTVGIGPLQSAEIQALGGAEDGDYSVVDNQYGYVCQWVLPVIDDEKGVVALIGADYDMSQILSVMRRNVLRVMAYALLILLVTFFTLMLLLHFSVLKPIRIISERMKHFLQDRHTQLPPVRGIVSAETADIAESFSRMSEDITSYLSDIETLTTEKVQASVELDVARKIQCGMVPPKTELRKDGLEVSAFMQPAWEVGGDFYDVIDLPGGKLGIVIGDVSGKGIGAALFMAMTRRVIRDRLCSSLDPAPALLSSNLEICRENPEGMFATVFAAVWDPQAKTLICANAGHTPPAFFGRKTGLLEVDTGIALGLFEDADIKNQPVRLEAGQGLLLYTDGVSEARSGKRELFGTERILQVLGTAPDSAEAAVSAVTQAVAAFEEGTDRADDLTVVSLLAVGTD